MAAQDNLKVATIFGRTASGSATGVPDLDQEEIRLLTTAMLRPGYTPNLIDQTTNLNAFKVRQDTGSNMQIKVGSGTSKADGYVLLGTVAGQGAYILRLDATTKTVTVPAADATNPRKYLVAAVIDDTAYSGTASRAYANVVCIAGTPATGNTSVVPSPLSTWSAYAPLWSFQLAANATAVTNTILDNAQGADLRAASRPAGGIGGKVASAVVNGGGSQALSISNADVTSATVTFINPGNRVYKISALGTISGIASAITQALNINTGASGTGTVLIESNITTSVANIQHVHTPWVLHTPAAGSVSYHLTASVSSSTGTLLTAATKPAMILVEDVGSSV